MKLFIIFFFIFTINTHTDSQIVIIPNEVSQILTSYTAHSNQHDIFIFSDPNNNNDVAMLTANDTSSNTSSTFLWKEYKPETHTFDSISSFRTINNIPSGGYVIIVNNGTITEHSDTVWIFNNSLRVDVEEEDLIEKENCEHFQIGSEIILDTFEYYDLTSFDTLTLMKGIKSALWTWKTGTKDEFIITLEHKTETLSVLSPLPAEETMFTLTVTDSLEIIDSSTVIYTPVRVKADFTMEADDPDKLETEGGGTSLTGLAPLKMNFTNTSYLEENIKTLTWFFNDDNNTNEIQTTNFTSSFTYSKYKEGGYDSIFVVVESNAGCIDTSNFQTIKVLKSELKIPNVFTPNNDGINEIFRVKYLSLKTFTGRIYNKQGRKIFEWNDPEEGWNGGNAPSGVYFYSIKAVDFNNLVYDKKGTLQLFR